MEPRQIGSRLELFVDRYLIDVLAGTAVLRLHRPRPAETVLTFDRPWEGGNCAYATVIKDGERLRLYYRGQCTEGDKSDVYCLAESRDGIRFTRPELQLVEAAGSTTNNVIYKGPVAHSFSPMLDPRVDCPPAQRYKALAATDLRKEHLGLMALASADGVHWSPLQNHFVITQGKFDSQNVAFWSEHENCFVCYFRTLGRQVHEETRLRRVRSISRCISRDFLHWSEPEAMTFGDSVPEDLYISQTQPYFRAPHLYVAFPKRFVPRRRVLTDAEVAEFCVSPRQLDAVSECVFMTSRGGNRFDRTFMEAFVRPGLDRQNWVARNAMAALNLVQTGPEEMSLYLQQHYAQPSHFLRRFTLRLDGFASVSATFDGGFMTTRPLTFTGSRLVLNYSTGAAGGIRVEVQDADGQPIPGYLLADADMIYGDQIERTVTWRDRSDLAALAGRPIRLRFDMQDADLFTIRFR